MALSIQSPGVQIIETDLSQNITIPGGTYVFVPGFASQGPTDEVIQVTSISEFEQIFGTPSNPAERYFYYNCQAVLNSNGNLLTTRLPYGSGNGDAFATQYSALLYPVVTGGNTFNIGAPTHVTFGQSTFQALQQGNFTWSNNLNATPGIVPSGNSYTVNAGLIVLNSAQTSVDEFNQGYYISLADNTNWGPNAAFTSIQAINSLSAGDSFYSIPTSTLSFTLTAAAMVDH